MRFLTLIAGAMVFLGDTAHGYNGGCPALVTLSPCTRLYGACGGGHYGGQDCECMYLLEIGGYTCQGKIDLFYVVTILPKFPSQTCACEHKTETGICYKYHLCNRVGTGEPTAPCTFTSDCVHGTNYDCLIGIATYIEDDCEPKACNPRG